MSRVRIAPSILAADFTRLGEEIQAAEAARADWIHVDVMDGHFVPNISFGPVVAQAARRVTSLPLDVHLMIEAPEQYLRTFAEAGAGSITVHFEACRHLHRTVQMIRELGVSPGVAVNPATPVEALSEILPFVDLVLVMSVNPGFGGQSFIESSVDKVRRLRELVRERGLAGVEVEVDGGVDASNAAALVEAGATVLVAGSAVFGDGDVEGNLRRLRQAAGALAQQSPGSEPGSGLNS